MENILTYAYSFIPLIGMLGYVPQIRTLLRPEVRGTSISLATWAVWLATWIVSLGYGAICLQDILFSITCSMNIVGHVFIILLVLYKRTRIRTVLVS